MAYLECCGVNAALKVEGLSSEERRIMAYGWFVSKAEFAPILFYSPQLHLVKWICSVFCGTLPLNAVLFGVNLEKLTSHIFPTKHPPTP
jgi:hypothetical protein